MTPNEHLLEQPYGKASLPHVHCTAFRRITHVVDLTAGKRSLPRVKLCNGKNVATIEPLSSACN